MKNRKRSKGTAEQCLKLTKLRSDITLFQPLSVLYSLFSRKEFNSTNVADIDLLRTVVLCETMYHG